jgi:seryl-tRNA synthetase
VLQLQQQLHENVQLSASMAAVKQDGDAAIKQLSTEVEGLQQQLAQLQEQLSQACAMLGVSCQLHMLLCN